MVGACHTDLDDESEKVSRYYDHPWDWDAIKANQNWILQFHSTDDPFIPVEEARFVHDHLHTEYHEDTDQGHYQGTEIPELIEALKQKI